MTILYASTILTLLLTVNEKYQFSKSYKGLEVYITIVIAINLMLIFGYLLLDFRATYIYSRAERTRALQYLDNSFETNFAGKRVENYFTQDKLAPGFYKLTINCFENAYHTLTVIKEMQSKSYIKAIAVVLVFIFSAAVGEKGVVRSLIEAILPLVLVQDAVKLSYFITRLENLTDNFKTFFTLIRTSGFKDKEPEAMRYVIEYETTLAWASMPTDSKIFNRLQNQLANEWKELKEEYNME